MESESKELATDEQPIDIFAGLKKKKKKKKKTLEEEEEQIDSPSTTNDFQPDQQPTIDESAPLDPPNTTTEDLDNLFEAVDEPDSESTQQQQNDANIQQEESTLPTAASTTSLDSEFLSLKDKKKKKKKRPDYQDFEALLQEQEGSSEVPVAEERNVFDLDKQEVVKNDEAWVGSNRDYTYDELLNRVFKILRQNNPELAGEKRRYTIVPPSIHREGTKKTLFANLVEICKRMHRQPDHVMQYLFSELGTSGSVDGSQRLIIKGRFQQKQIENVLKRYIVEYVTCKTCKSGDTILTKENRLFFLQCESCGSTRTVSAIKVGFKATTKDMRKEKKASEN